MWISDEERQHYAALEARWEIIKKRRGKRKAKRQRRREKRKGFKVDEMLKQELRICSLRCKLYLKEFWEKFNLESSDMAKLELLKRAANPKWIKVTEPCAVELRAQFNRKKREVIAMDIAEKCATCDKKPTERHHIIPVMYGGTPVAENLILLCIGCHDEIHPWMKA